MTRAPGPRAPLTTGSGAGVWIVALAGWGLAGLTGLVWVAARIAAALTGGHVPPFGEQWVVSLARGRTGRAWPGTPTAWSSRSPLSWRAPPGRSWWRGGSSAAASRARRPGRRAAPQPGDPAAHPGPVGPDRHPAAPLAGRDQPRRLSPADTGLLLGDLLQPSGRGPALYASWEDTIVAFMAPRSGKTTALGVPYVLSAPGPVVATSIKADLWAATAQLRAEAGGAVWLFDPQRITCQPQEWWWDPLRGMTTVEAAHRMAAHFVLTVADGQQARPVGAGRPGTAVRAVPRRGVLRPVRCAMSPAGSVTPPPRPRRSCWTRPGSGRWRPACAARRTAPRKPATAFTRPPAPRRPACTTRRSCRGSPRRPQPLPVFSPAAFAAQPRHAVPADRVPGGGVPADRRADRHGHARRPAAAERPAAGSTRRWC